MNKEQIKSKLFPVMQATNARQRGTTEQTASAAQIAQIEAVKLALEEHGYDCGTTALYIVAAATGQPWLLHAIEGEEQDGTRTLEPLSVVRLKTDSGTVANYKGAYYITLADGRLLARNGLRGPAVDEEQYELADDEGIQKCLDDLTPRQFAAIEANSLFCQVLKASS